MFFALEHAPQILNMSPTDHETLRRWSRGISRALAALVRFRHTIGLASAFVLGACAPDLTVGEWICAGEAIPDDTDPIGAPWETGFENQFCDYTQLAGFCYAEDRATFTTVTEPVHSGRFAAAFKIRAGDSDGYQTRCVRQGVLPAEAYYGAWYFVPARASNAGNWNLIHFQGGSRSGQHGLWDISLVNATNGDLELVVFDFLNGATRRPARTNAIPVNVWFHIEFYLKRAADKTGAVALYQDGQLLLDVKNVITDDSSWGQWYVGNLADALTPRDSTLYVDDVTIRTTR